MPRFYSGPLSVIQSAGAAPSVSFDQIGTLQFTHGRLSTFTMTGVITVGATANALLAVINTPDSLSGGNWTTMGVNWNAVPMTQLFNQDQGGGAFGNLSFWALMNPSSGANNFVINISGGSAGNVGGIDIIAYSFIGANPSLASAFPSVGSAKKYDTSTTSDSISATAVAGEIVVGADVAQFGNAPTNNFTSDWTVNNATSNNLSWSGGHAIGAAGGTFSASQSPADQLFLGMQAVSP